MTAELKKAVKALAQAFRLTLDLYEQPNHDAKTYYHAAEYSDQMRSLLLEQLLTDCDDLDEADGILREYNLDYLIEDLHIKASEWSRE